MPVFLREQPFDPWPELSDYSAAAHLQGKVGATSAFIGTMRDFNQGVPVSAMVLEHYPEMTQKYLEALCARAAAQWELLDSLVIHRYGSIAIGAPIVLVAVWSAHRQAAFAACHYIMEDLKTRAPFWKREQTDRGPRWVAPE